ncbi:MAG: ATP-dependent zinc metalloprotease FtsH [Actinomycetota bacterium]
MEPLRRTTDDKKARPPDKGRPEPTPWRVEGERPGTRPGSGDGYRPFGRRFWWILFALLAINWLSVLFFPGEPERIEVPYTVFYEQLDEGNVKEIRARGEDIQGQFEEPVTYPEEDGETSASFDTVRPSFADDNLYELLVERDVVVSAEPLEEPRSLLATLLIGFGPTLLLVGLFVLLMRRMAGGGGLGGLGRSRARLFDASGKRTTFDDVAGIDDAEEQLVEIVDFLKNPDRYRKLGAAIPKGVLLSGPPGTGKTLLARAVAGEADVPFFSLSASEFIEMIVGVGASRVRDLFQQAKEAAPSIIFIDELDAIGRSRGRGAAIGGHDEREQTLNQILTEMDGFTGTEGVIVLAATNRPDVLDTALLRPGRFDRRVAVSPPDQKGREHILGVHTREVPLAEDADLGAIAASAPGMVGADLKNLVNEAALLAARRDHEKVTLSDFMDALEKVVLGAERRIVLSPEDRRRTAYHESGHAVLGMLQPGADPVRKVSIVPRGEALGVTFQSPESDRYGYGTAYLRGRIIGALGGYAAEELVYGDVTTGAEADLEQVTRIARQMVGRWGMSDAVGKVSVLPRPDDEAALFPGSRPASDRTLELVDEEVRRIVDECYAEALERLGENRDRLDRLVDALMERETLDEAEIYRIAGIDRTPDKEEAELAPAKEIVR